MFSRTTTIAALAVAALVSACGGGADGADQVATASAERALIAASASQHAQAGRQVPLASTSAGTYSAEQASKLYALAESSFAAYFPSQQATRTFDGWSYRYYPETSTYLAVIGDQVFVMGGAFGPEVTALGLVSKFVGTAPSGSERPLTAGILNQCPDVVASTSPQFYSCMVGHLTGTQAFNTGKACRLDVSPEGVLTLSSDGASKSMGPTFGRVNFTKNSSFGNFIALLYGPGASTADMAQLQVMASPSISFAQGGTLKAEYTPAGSSTASLTCTLTVPN